MKKAMAVAIVATGLSGCAGAPAVPVALEALPAFVGGVATVGRALYCEGLTEEGRQAFRDEHTDGVQYLPCPTPVGE